MRLLRYTSLMALPLLLFAGFFTLIYAGSAGEASSEVSGTGPGWVQAEEAARKLMADMIDGKNAGVSVPGAVMTVTTPIPDINPDLLCSLIEAMENANDDAQTHVDCPAGSGADVIELSAGTTYTLTAVHNTLDGPNGLPSVTGDITINGHGATIARSTVPDTPPFRIAHVSANGSLRLDDVTIRYGYLLSGFGGGIRNEMGLLVLVDSTVRDNVIVGEGGGIMSNGASATLVISNSHILSNTSELAGGIRNSNGSNAVIGGSVISGNVAIDPVDSAGGGIFNGFGGVMTIMDSTISHNLTDGGVFSSNGNGGGILNQESTMTVIRCTVSHNQAIGYGNFSGNGGGIGSTDGQLTVANSTISGNSATGSDAYLYSGGGGGITNGNYFDSADSTLTLINSTIAYNEANVSGGGIAVADIGTATAVTMVTENSVIASNSAPADIGCYNDGGILNSNGHNLEDGDSCNFDHPTDLVNRDPLLGSLQDNGGPTLTHALLDYSPAIDAGDDLACAAAPVNGVDQRGVARPIGPHCDMGSFESSANPLLKLYLPLLSGSD